MRPRRFAIVAAGLCGTAILVGCVVAAVSGLGLADIKNTHAQSIEDRASEMGPEAVSAAATSFGVIRRFSLAHASIGAHFGLIR
jgi:hypothetical protein